jgi:predicted RNase H-like HicB family nuclease
MARVDVRQTDQGRVNIDVQLPGTIRHDGERFIAACPLLDVVSQGPTEEEAKVNLIDALGFFFESCLERGTLLEVLHNAGFSYEPAAEPITDAVADDESSFPIHVPLPFVIHGHSQRDSHAT